MLKRWVRVLPKRWRKPSVWLNAFARVLRLVPVKTRVLVISGLFISGLLELFGLTMIIPLLATAAQVREAKGGLMLAVRAAWSRSAVIRSGHPPRRRHHRPVAQGCGVDRRDEIRQRFGRRDQQ